MAGATACGYHDAGDGVISPGFYLDGGTDPRRTEGAVGIIVLRCQQASGRCKSYGPASPKPS